MKWPVTLALVRHAQSAYNILRAQKEKDPLWQAFRAAYDADYTSAEVRRLAEEVLAKYGLGVSDYDTPLTDEGMEQAFRTGLRLQSFIPVPHVIYVSPYLRTQDTLRHITRAWAALKEVKTVPDDRLREQEHGLALLYNDWRVFHVFHPEQKRLRDLLGPYWYQFPQGESASQVRDRHRSWISTLIREHAGEHVLVVSHHQTILAARANHERLSPERYIMLDEHGKPRNCGVTIYKGDPQKGANGRLVLVRYNMRLY